MGFEFKNAATNRGRLPSKVLSTTAALSACWTVSYTHLDVYKRQATLIAMKGYSLTGEKMKEIQAVNACRRDAVAKGMKLDEAIAKWQSMDQLPAEYRS